MQVKQTTLTDSQIDHASKWCVAFVKTFKNELKTTGVPYAMIYAEYKKTTNFPIGDKAFAPMLHVCGLEKTHRNNTVTYILLKTI
jgi:hypothetical protein